MLNKDVADVLEVLQLKGLYLDLQTMSKRNSIDRILRMRRSRGQFYTLFRELKQNPAKFKRYTRMSIACFEKLLHLLRPRLKRNSIRAPISREQRRVVCLRFLATGSSFRQLHFDFFLGVKTVRRICHETCQAIQDVLGPTYVRMPATEQEWTVIATDFWKRWQLPNCIGPIDGKHVQMRAPAHSGSLYFNYKKHFSTVLLAVVDAKYRVAKRVRTRCKCKMVRYTDRYRRSVIHEIHVPARVIWDPQEPQFYSSGARKYAFGGVAERLGLKRTLRDALYGNVGFEDIRRMWRQWILSFYAYKMRRISRKPKFHAELSFLNELSMDQLSTAAAMY